MNATMQGSTAAITDGAMVPVSNSPVLLTGKIKIANDLVKAFCADEGENRRFSIVWDAAFNVRYTPIDLEENLKHAMAQASEMDTREGFKPKEGAKGLAKYGPRRTAMNVRASEIRQLFGALCFTNAAKARTDDGQEIIPLIAKTDGFTRAVKLARGALKDQKINWDGTPAKTDEQRQQERAMSIVNGVREQWVKEHPQKAGESIKDYSERMNSAVEILTLETQKAKHEEMVKSESMALIKKYGLEFAAELAEQVIEAYNAHLEKQAEEAKAAKGEATDGSVGYREEVMV